MQETRKRILSITQINNDQPLLARFRDYGFLSLGWGGKTVQYMGIRRVSTKIREPTVGSGPCCG